jgi:aspartyl-tRNA(Asn)/glutamyl-tRNA(Gln) amidotransferase subunit C
MNIKDVENLAELARIELSEDEKKGLLTDMGSILDYIKQIERVDVQHSVLNSENCNVWREDLPAGAGEITSREFSRELITEQFPDSQGGFLKVKKIL